VATLLRLARLLPVELDVRGLVAEAKRQLRQEADYRIEAASLRRYRALVADEPALLVPAVHDDLSTRHVLAMDFVDGDPIESLGAPRVPQAERDAVGAVLERLVFRELFEFRFVQTDPNFANYRIDRARRRIGLLDFGSTREVDPALSRKYARICRALLAGDREGVRAGAIE